MEIAPYCLCFSLRIGNMEDNTSPETQHVSPESSIPCMLGSEDALKLGWCCLLIALSHPRTLESLTPGTLSPNELGEDPKIVIPENSIG